MTRRSAGNPGGEGRDEGPDLHADWIESVRRDLLAWYDREKRSLPWRDRPEPYRVLVSEVMLVQTTVEAVIPYFERFVAAFPTVTDLARADEDEVLKLWEGLGYYRRARNLHAAARAIVANHGGRVPAEAEALRGLPGVGRYIAGAVGSIAHGRPEPVLEANTQRVLARWIAWDRPVSERASQDRLWRGAARLVPADRPGEFNQAFMELGALICVPRSPRCLACPVRAHCRAYKGGTQEAIPRKEAKEPPQEVGEAALVIEREGKLLLLKRGGKGLWAGFWELPTVHLLGPDPAGRGVTDYAGIEEAGAALTGLCLDVGPPLHTIRFGVTRYRVNLVIVRASVVGGEARPGLAHEAVEWVGEEEAGALTISAPQRRALNWYLRRGRSDRPDRDGRDP
jgi:A/G-specific adenine glycosylase